MRPVSKSCMTRLPDELPVQVAGTPQEQRRDIAAPNTARSTSRPSVRPNSSSSTKQRKASLSRMPTDTRTTASVPSASSLTSRSTSESVSATPKASDSEDLSWRLDSDDTSVKVAEPVVVAPVVAPPVEVEPVRERLPLTSSTRAHTTARERLKKRLTVSTTVQHSMPRPAAFRALQEGEAIYDLYAFEEEIYSAGRKGKVVNATRKSDGSEVVVKIRSKRTHKAGERVWRAVMEQFYGMQHSHVLDILEILEDKSAFYVVMPKCNGGELFEFLVTEAEVPETECKRILREILHAVGHLHKHNLVHRDIKPENIMFTMDMADIHSPKTVKLIDFDTCLEWSPTTPKSRRFVGTPGYIAPEALMGMVTPQSDLWSIGVIHYILMTGETPWSQIVSLEDGIVGSAGANKMYDALKAENFEWEREPWPDFPLARDLCQKLLAFRVEDRPLSVEEALAHPWLADD